MKITPKMNIVGKDSLFAIGDVVLDDLFVIHDVKVVVKDEEYKVFLPRKAGTNGWSNIVEASPELYSQIKEAVVLEVGRSVKDFDGWKYDMSDVSVQVKVYEKDELRGFATLDYKGVLKIKGIQIRDGEAGKKFTLDPGKDYPVIDLKTGSEKMRSGKNLIASFQSEDDLMKIQSELMSRIFGSNTEQPGSEIPIVNSGGKAR